jgi:hypothetical protein
LFTRAAIDLNSPVYGGEDHIIDAIAIDVTGIHGSSPVGVQASHRKDGVISDPVFVTRLGNRHQRYQEYDNANGFVDHLHGVSTLTNAIGARRAVLTKGYRATTATEKLSPRRGAVMRAES